jgi:hypothetical protein
VWPLVIVELRHSDHVPVAQVAARVPQRQDMGYVARDAVFAALGMRLFRRGAGLRRMYIRQVGQMPSSVPRSPHRLFSFVRPVDSASSRPSCVEGAESRPLDRCGQPRRAHGPVTARRGDSVKAAASGMQWSERHP